MMSKQQEPSHDSLLARIDALAAEALGLVERSHLEQRMTRALRLVAEDSYRAIARECGYPVPRQHSACRAALWPPDGP
jgi:hypothetical protein